MFHWWRFAGALAAGAAAGVWRRSVGARRLVALWRAAEGRRVKCASLRSGEGRSCSGLVRALGSARLWLRRLLSAARGS